MSSVTPCKMYVSPIAPRSDSEAAERGCKLLERSPIDNLDMNETGIGGWGGQFHDLGGTLCFTTMTTLYGTGKLTDSRFVVVAQSCGSPVDPSQLNEEGKVPSGALGCSLTGGPAIGHESNSESECRAAITARSKLRGHDKRGSRILICASRQLLGSEGSRLATGSVGDYRCLPKARFELRTLPNPDLYRDIPG